MTRRSASPARRSRPRATRRGVRPRSSASKPSTRSAPEARLAFALLLYTGQRRSDVVRMGRQDIHTGVLAIDQRKTEGGDEAHLEIPVHPKLREIIDATPTVGVKTFLVTQLRQALHRARLRKLVSRIVRCRRVSRRVGAWITQGTRSSSGRDRMQCKSDRSDHRARLARGSTALHEGSRPQAHGARGDEEAR